MNVRKVKRHNGLEINVPDPDQSKKPESFITPQPSKLKKRSKALWAKLLSFCLAPLTPNDSDTKGGVKK